MASGRGRRSTLANRAGLGTWTHGTPDDIPLSPRALVAEARAAGLAAGAARPDLRLAAPAGARAARHPQARPARLAAARRALRAHAAPDRARLSDGEPLRRRALGAGARRAGPAARAARRVRARARAARSGARPRLRRRAPERPARRRRADRSPTCRRSRSSGRGGGSPQARVVELEPTPRCRSTTARFDLVLCAETIEHVRDVQLLLSEIRRVLRPGGRLALTTPASAAADAPARTRSRRTCARSRGARCGGCWTSSASRSGRCGGARGTLLALATR